MFSGPYCLVLSNWGSPEKFRLYSKSCSLTREYVLCSDIIVPEDQLSVIGPNPAVTCDSLTTEPPVEETSTKQLTSVDSNIELTSELTTELQSSERSTVSAFTSEPTTILDATTQRTTVHEATTEPTTVAESTNEPTTVLEATTQSTTVFEATTEPTTLTTEPTTLVESTNEPTTVLEATFEPTIVLDSASDIISLEPTSEQTNVLEETSTSTALSDSAIESTTIAIESLTEQDSVTPSSSGSLENKVSSTEVLQDVSTDTVSQNILEFTNESTESTLEGLEISPGLSSVAPLLHHTHMTGSTPPNLLKNHSSWKPFSCDRNHQEHCVHDFQTYDYRTVTVLARLDLGIPLFLQEFHEGKKIQIYFRNCNQLHVFQ